MKKKRPGQTDKPKTISPWHGDNKEMSAEDNSTSPFISLVSVDMTSPCKKAQHKFSDRGAAVQK